MRILMGKGRAAGPAAAGPRAGLPCRAALRPGPTGGGERSRVGGRLLYCAVPCRALPLGAAGGGEGGDGAGSGSPFLGSALPLRPGVESRAEVGGPGRACGGSGRLVGAAGRRRRSGSAGSAARRSGPVLFCRPPPPCLVRRAARRFSRSSARATRCGAAVPSAARQTKRWRPIPTGRSRFKRSRAAAPRSALPPPFLLSFSALPACVCPQLRGTAPQAFLGRSVGRRCAPSGELAELAGMRCWLCPAVRLSLRL